MQLFCSHLPHCIQVHVTPLPFGLLIQNKNFRTIYGQESKVVYVVFVDLKLPSLNNHW